MRNEKGTTTTRQEKDYILIKGITTTIRMCHHQKRCNSSTFCSSVCVFATSLEFK